MPHADVNDFRFSLVFKPSTLLSRSHRKWFIVGFTAQLILQRQE